MSDPCEWNPELNELATTEDKPHGDAEISCGTGDRDIHLCASCAELPRFKRYKKTRLHRVGLSAPTPGLPEGVVDWPRIDRVRQRLKNPCGRLPECFVCADARFFISVIDVLKERWERAVETEREECAKECERAGGRTYVAGMYNPWDICAIAIRARSEADHG